MRAIMLAPVFVAWMLASPAAGEPWAVSGQTQIPDQGGIDNPQPADTGAIGAVLHLPYVVPAGRTLCIDHMAVEAYDVPGTSVLFIFTGVVPAGLPEKQAAAFRIQRATGSVGARAGSTQHSGRFCFPGGLTINFRLLNGQTYAGSDHPGGIYGWQATGELMDDWEFLTTR